MTEYELTRLVAGDQVSIDGLRGQIGFSRISITYAAGFPKTDWDSTEYDGIMIEQENGALVFYSTDFLLSNLSLVRRI